MSVQMTKIKAGLFAVDVNFWEHARKCFVIDTPPKQMEGFPWNSALWVPVGNSETRLAFDKAEPHHGIQITVGLRMNDQYENKPVGDIGGRYIIAYQSYSF